MYNLCFTLTVGHILTVSFVVVTTSNLFYFRERGQGEYEFTVHEITVFEI